MSKAAVILRNAGLTNSLFDMSELVGNRQVRMIETWCNSYTCSGQLTAKKNGLLVRVTQGRGVEKCPRCGSTNHLFYKTAKEET